MPLGTKFSNTRSRLTSQLGSALTTPAVRRRIAHRGQQIPSVSPFAAYFADSLQGTYQLEQWLPAFQRLAAAGTPITLLVTNANSANRLVTVGGLPVYLCPGSADVEDFADRHKVQVLFYVNNNQSNFTPLRINGLIHVHLSHGESEKSSMVSNQLKAYDRAFIAGPAARERILTHVRGIDPAHLVEIGRPQLDLNNTKARESTAQTVVLYAPTWEGDSPSMAYSSLVYSGRELVSLLAADERLQLAFRPHPKTGTRSRIYSKALRQVRHLLGPTSRFNPLWDRTKPVGGAIADISRADVVISDISAMAMDAVGLNKPTVVLTTRASAATGTMSQLASAVPTWSEVPKDAVQRILDLASEGVSERQLQFREHIFGQDEHGSGTERFVHAARGLLSPPTSGQSGGP